jgi:hypothetical protein
MPVSHRAVPYDFSFTWPGEEFTSSCWVALAIRLDASVDTLESTLTGSSAPPPLHSSHSSGSFSLCRPALSLRHINRTHDCFRRQVPGWRCDV